MSPIRSIPFLMVIVFLFSCRFSAREEIVLFLDDNPRPYMVQVFQMKKDSILHYDSILLKRIVNQSDAKFDMSFVFRPGYTEKYTYAQNADTLLLQSAADISSGKIDEIDFMYLSSKRFNISGYSHRVYKYVLDFGTIDGASLLFFSAECGTILRIYSYSRKGVKYLSGNDLACGNALLQAILSDKQFMFVEGHPPPPPPPID